MSTLFWPLLFLGLGLLLLVAEVFVPSGGFMGLSAVFCLALSLWYAFQQSFMMGVCFILADSVVLPLTFSAAFYVWSRTPLGRRVFLQPPSPEEIEVSHSDHQLDHLIGQVGRSLTPLRPSGHLEFEGRRIDGLAEEGFVPAGAAVRAVGVRSGQLVVRGLLDRVEQAHEPPLEPLDLDAGSAEAPMDEILREGRSTRDPSRPDGGSPAVSTTA